MKTTTLKKRSQFITVAKKGSKAAAKGLILQVNANNNSEKNKRIGFTVTKKIGNAVTRNRVKRRLRAAAKIIQTNAKDSYDYVIIGRKATIDRDFDSLIKDLKYTLHSTNTYISS